MKKMGTAAERESYRKAFDRGETVAKIDRLKYQKLMEEAAKPDPDPLKVGFYDATTDTMVAVEDWTTSIHMARFASVQMATMYQTGRHRMPSPVWCVWNKNEHASIFFLDEKPRDVAFLNHVLTLLV